MNLKYQAELDAFKENFKKDIESRIILYGIGRYTATLLEGLTEFKFVALMDKEPENIGKKMFGLPIVSLEEAEKIADIIVINTSETYWSIIYQRISNSKLPVYYKNGKRAEKEQHVYYKNEFQNLTIEKLECKAKNAEIISFDFFDTMFTRSVCNPRDVQEILWKNYQTKWKSSYSYCEARARAIDTIQENYTFDELYQEISNLTGETEIIEEMKAEEFLLEKRILCERFPIIELLKRLQAQGKDIYILTDMYLPLKFYETVLRDHGICISSENILISGQLKKSKRDERLWKYYKEEIVKDKNALLLRPSQPDFQLI